MNKLIGIITGLMLLLLGCQPGEERADQYVLFEKTVKNLVAQSEKNLTIDADSSIWYAQQAWNLSKDLKGEFALDALYMLARSHYTKGEIYEALKFLIQAHELAVSHENTQRIADILNLEGNIYGSLGQYDKTIENYLGSLKAYHTLNDRRNEAKVFNNLGLVYYRMDQIEKAYTYHQRALGIWDSLGYKAGLGSSYTNISYIFTARAQYNEAIQYLDKALEIYKSLGNVRREANTYINFGEVYMHMNQPKKALAYFERSLPMSKQGGFNDIYTDGLNKKGWALHKLGRLDEAAITLKKGLSLAAEIKDPSLINEINLKLTDLYTSTGDFKSALQYQQKWSAIKDSIFRDKSAEYIALFEVMYKTEAKEKRIELLEEVNKRRSLLFQFSIFLALLLLIVIILIYSRYRIKVKFLEQQRINREKTLQQKELQVELEKSKNKQLEAENKLKEEENEKLQLDIQHRHSELSAVTLHLYQKNENLSQLIEEVEKIEKQVSSENRQSIRKLKQVISRNLNLDEDWNNFRMYFNQVHHGFLDKLKSNYPELTNHDLRHCSYIRMNLSTKEISRLMNINPTSVQKSRVRLKKKLNLNQDEELYEFLLKY